MVSFCWLVEFSAVDRYHEMAEYIIVEKMNNESWT